MKLYKYEPIFPPNKYPMKAMSGNQNNKTIHQENNECWETKYKKKMNRSKYSVLSKSCINFGVSVFIYLDSARSWLYCQFVY